MGIKIDGKTRAMLLSAQRNEITEHFIYRKIASSMKSPKNKRILGQIAADELRHYNIWKKYSGEDARPDRLKAFAYYLISGIFGITFSIKLMEKGEDLAQKNYRELSKDLPEAKKVMGEEKDHEDKLIGMIDEERLRYVGSIVLGLNDALVELTGALAGFTFALQNSGLISITGLITGIAAALSMAASEYLSTKSESGSKSPLKAAVYTGITYIFTVLFLILPYFILPNIYLSLSLTIINAILVIFIFTFYISVAKDVPFKKRFIEMAAISLGVAFVSFILGFAIRILLNVEI